MFVYALYLVRLLEQPFAKEHASFDDVSLFLLYEFEDVLRSRFSLRTSSACKTPVERPIVQHNSHEGVSARYYCDPMSPCHRELAAPKGPPPR
jgi:hypothetical protein